MTTLKLEIKEFIKDIDSEETLNKLKQYLKRLKKNSPPCQYTLEELKARLARGRKEMENDGGTEHDEFMKEVETWF
jgi:ribosome-interacting GTPase 1